MPPSILFLLTSTRNRLPGKEEVFMGMSSNLPNLILRANNPLPHHPPLPTILRQALHWKCTLAITGLPVPAIKRILYRANAGVKGISQSLLHTGKQRNPMLHKMGNLCKLLSEEKEVRRSTPEPPYTATETQEIETETKGRTKTKRVVDKIRKPRVMCHWGNIRGVEDKDIVKALNLEWHEKIAHVPLDFEQIRLESGNLRSFTKKCQTRMRKTMPRKAVTKKVYWRAYQRSSALRARNKMEAARMERAML